MNTNYNENVAGALKLVTINGQTYQIGKDATSEVGGIMKLYSNLNAANTDGAVSQAAVKTAIENAGAASKTVVAKANGESYITLTSEVDSTDGHMIYTIGTTGIDSAISTAIAGVVDGADAAFDTLKEVADWIQADTTGAQAIINQVADKADKVTGATNGNFAGLDSNGNLTDSGSKASDFATAAQGAKADSAVQSISINGQDIVLDASKGANLGSNYVQDSSYVHTDNNYDNAAVSKLSGIATGAQVNVIETVKVNGTALTPDANKAVDVTVPTKTSDLTNDSNFAVDASYVHTDNNYTTAEKNKLSAISASVSNDTLVIVTAAAA